MMYDHDYTKAINRSVVEKFFGELSNGVDWGRKFIVRWQSKNGRFVIFTRPGYTGWYCIGQQMYYATDHYLCDTQRAPKVHKSGMDVMAETVCAHVEGRLSKKLLDEWIEQVKEKS